MKKVLLVPLVLIGVLVCTAPQIDSSDFVSQIEDSEQYKVNSEGMIVLGRQLKNPYSLDNMQTALDSLIKTKGGDEFPELVATDYYVRMRATDSTELRLLYGLNYDLFDYPLDYEIEEGGYYYHDPSIPENEMTWQYTVIGVDEIEEEIPHEVIKEAVAADDPIIGTIVEQPALGCAILDDCYIPNDIEVKTSKGTTLPVTAEELKQMAFRLAGYEIDGGIKTKGMGYYPHGTISIPTDSADTSFVNLQGVKVRIRSFVVWEDIVTDANGSYASSKKYLLNPFVEVRFEDNSRYKTVNGINILSSAYYSLGRRDRTKAINATIPQSSLSWHWAAISHWLYKYYEDCNRDGIALPPQSLLICCSDRFNGMSSAPLLGKVGLETAISSLEINTLLEAYAACLGVVLITPALIFLNTACPDIFFSIGGDNSLMGTQNTIYHELSHASHYSVVGAEYWAQYISHIVRSVLNGEDCYGAGNRNDRKEHICEVGEAWGYLNSRLAGKANYGNGYWFSKAVDAFHSTLSISQVFKSDLFEALTPTTTLVDSVCINLCKANPSKADSIITVFKNAGAYHNLNTFTIKNNCFNSIVLISLNGDAYPSAKLRTGQQVTYTYVGPLNDFKQLIDSGIITSDLVIKKLEYRTFNETLLMSYTNHVVNKQIVPSIFDNENWEINTTTNNNAIVNNYVYEITNNTL
ncbi:MAG: hypothetical protein ACI3ZI_09180 [Candidatus Cryptobacteroides sp.]